MKKTIYTLMFLFLGCISSFAANVLKLASPGGDDIQVHPGMENELEVVLDNDDPVTSLQFDVYLPKGLSFVDNSQKKVNARVTRSSHQLLAVKQKDGAYRFGLLSTGTAIDNPTIPSAIKGNCGAIITFKVMADESFTGGAIEVNDILGSNATDPSQSVKEIDMPAYQNLKVEACAANAGLEAESLTLTPGKSGVVNVTLTNYTALCGLQAVITLPEGLKLVEGEDGEVVNYSNRLSENVTALVQAVEGEKNTYKLLLNSLSNDEFEGTEGVLFGLNVAADETYQDGNVVISDIKVSSHLGNAFDVKDVLACNVKQFSDPTGDGKWDMSDVYSVLNAVDTDNVICDLNHDGVVNIVDVYMAVSNIE